MRCTADCVVGCVSDCSFGCAGDRIVECGRDSTWLVDKLCEHDGFYVPQCIKPRGRNVSEQLL